MMASNRYLLIMVFHFNQTMHGPHWNALVTYILLKPPDLVKGEEVNDYESTTPASPFLFPTPSHFTKNYD